MPFNSSMGRPGSGANRNRDRVFDQIRRVYGGQQDNAAGEGDPLGVWGATQELPGESAFFDALLARRARGLEATAQSQRRSLYNALEARGLGQSSVVSIGLGDIGRQQGLGLQEAGADIANMQFLMREGRISDALAYERQKALMKYGKVSVPWWQSLLGTAGSALGTYFAMRDPSPEKVYS